jgi:hypothetical protein
MHKTIPWQPTISLVRMSSQAAAADHLPSAIRSWWWITSAMTKLRNFSAKTGSSPRGGGQGSEPGDLPLFPRLVGRRHPATSLERTHLLGALEPLGK